MIYNIKLYSDMGHLLKETYSSKIPDYIDNFVNLKVKLYINYATDNSNL